MGRDAVDATAAKVKWLGCGGGVAAKLRETVPLIAAENVTALVALVDAGDAGTDDAGESSATPPEVERARVWLDG